MKVVERDELDEAIKFAEELHERAKERFDYIKQQYHTALSEETIAANRMLDLILKKKNLK